MLALEAMSPTFTAIFFVVAVVLFLLATFNMAVKPNLVALGLAFFVFVYAWNALAAT